MTLPTLKLLSFDPTLRREHLSGTSDVSGLPSREVEERVEKSLMTRKLSWQQREKRGAWGHRN